MVVPLSVDRITEAANRRLQLLLPSTRSGVPAGETLQPGQRQEQPTPCSVALTRQSFFTLLDEHLLGSPQRAIRAWSSINCRLRVRTECLPDSSPSVQRLTSNSFLHRAKRRVVGAFSLGAFSSE